MGREITRKRNTMNDNGGGKGDAPKRTSASSISVCIKMVNDSGDQPYKENLTKGTERKFNHLSLI